MTAAEGEDEWLDQAWCSPDSGLAVAPSGYEYSAHRRLVLARSHQAKGRGLGPRDVAALLRNVVRSEQSKKGNGHRIRVPVDLTTAAGSDALAEASIVVHRVEGQHAWVGAREWTPRWLVGDEQLGPEAELYDSELRRNDAQAPPDASLLAFGWLRFHSEAQRKAVRTVLSAPPGSTVIVNLPTGSGKSLCAYLPAFLPLDDESGRIGVTPVVVPTVALALDLDKRCRAIFGHATAYRPGSDEAKEIADRVRSGIQGPVFLAPESLTTGMAEPLKAAAKAKLLKYFVVDEAHMITAWGDDFRPEFQHIAALRSELLSLTPKPFVTVLMSATLTEYSLRAIYDLFGRPGPVKQVHAVRLRPEPAYWIRRASGEAERTAWVIEAVHHLPRPLILYVTKRVHAAKWKDILNGLGYSRVGMMHGDTDDGARARLLEAWDRDELDIVVATSAFGLGVDKPGVRAVVHATCPEDIDRYYQDVGRTGRDGYPSIALMLWTDVDLKTARSLAIPTFIGVDRGYARWETMFTAKEASDHGGYHFDVPLDVSPDIDMSSEENERWNLRTLLLMARASLIDIHGSRITQTPHRRFVTVGIEDFDHLRPERWEAKIEPLREDLLRSNRDAWEGLQELLGAKKCFGQYFKKTYSVDAFGVNVVDACGGCPKCRSEGSKTHCGHLFARVESAEPWPATRLGTGLSGWMNGASMGLLFFDQSKADALEQDLQSFVRWACGQGVRNIVLPPDLGASWRDLLSSLGRKPLFLHDRMPRGVERDQPTLVIATGVFHRDWGEAWATARASKAVNILALPMDSGDPTCPQRLLSETQFAMPRLTIEQWKEQYEE